MRPRRFLLILSLWLIFLLAPFLPCDALLKEGRSLLGTVVEITIISPEESRGRAGMEEAFAEIRRIEDLMSFFRPGSEVSRINWVAPGEAVQVSEEVFSLLQHAQALSDLTEGAFDVTFAPLWQLWGRCAKEKRLPSAEELTQAKALLDYRKVLLCEENREVRLVLPGMKVNLGGIAKGYALSRAGGMLRGVGLDNFLINLGGDVLAVGEGKEGKGWRIGIQHPWKAGKFIGVLSLRDCFVLTSGDYERYFKIEGQRYHHILDCRSGYPASGCSQVTLLTERLATDYLPSVVLFLLGPEKGLRLIEGRPELAALIVTPEGEVVATSNFSPHLEAPLSTHIDMAPAD